MDALHIGQTLGAAITPAAPTTPQIRYATIEAIGADGTLDVLLDGAHLRGVAAVTGCVGAEVGMRCLLVRQGNLATAIGLIARSPLAEVRAPVVAPSIEADAASIGSLNVGGGLLSGDGTELKSNRDLRSLWSSALYMNAEHTANLSERISDQMSGVVLSWSAYVSGSAQDYSWQHFFVPKSHVALSDGKGVGFVLSDPTGIGQKYVYIYDSQIRGHASNMRHGVYNGQQVINDYWVLRRVWGV